VVSTRQFTNPLFPPPPCPESFGGVGMNVCSAIEPRSVITGVSYRNRASFGRFLSPCTPYGPQNHTKSSGWGIFPTQHPAPHSSRFPGSGGTIRDRARLGWFPRSGPVREGLRGNPRSRAGPRFGNRLVGGQRPSPVALEDGSRVSARSVTHESGHLGRNCVGCHPTKGRGGGNLHHRRQTAPSSSHGALVEVRGPPRRRHRW
jgi:hypothetical protein